MGSKPFRVPFASSPGFDVARQTVQQKSIPAGNDDGIPYGVVATFVPQTGRKTADQPCVLAQIFIFETGQFPLARPIFPAHRARILAGMALHPVVEVSVWYVGPQAFITTRLPGIRAKRSSQKKFDPEQSDELELLAGQLEVEPSAADQYFTGDIV
jgi:hypothetical protein